MATTTTTLPAVAQMVTIAEDKKTEFVEAEEAKEIENKKQEEEGPELLKRKTTQLEDLRHKAEVKRIHKYYSKSELPLEVGLRISVTEITHIDTTKQQYGIKGYLVYNWRATKNDVKNFIRSQEVGGEKIKYEPEYVPDLHFANDVEILNYEEKQDTKIEFSKNHGDTPFNSQTALFINIVFTQEFNVKNFPFDVQDLRMILTTLMHDRIEEIRLVPSLIHSNQFKVDKTWSSIVHWDVMNIDIAKSLIGGSSKGKKQYDLIAFRIQVKRKWRGILWRFILWLLVLGTMSLATFAIDPVDDASGRLGYAVTMSLTVVAFQFVVQSYIPAVDYLTILDLYNLFTFGFVLLITIETAFIAYLEQGHGQFDYYFSRTLGGVFLLGNVAFALYAHYKRKEECKKLSNWDDYRTRFLTFISDEKKNVNKDTNKYDFKIIDAHSQNDKIFS